MDPQYSVSYYHSKLADSVVDTADESSVVDFQTLWYFSPHYPHFLMAVWINKEINKYLISFQTISLTPEDLKVSIKRRGLGTFYPK